MSLFKQVRDNAISNKHKREEGKDLVIPLNRFPKLSTVIPGIQKGRYYIVTSGPKAGKTSYVDSIFVMEPIHYLLTNPDTNIDLEIVYFSLEMSKEDKIKQLISNKIYTESGRVISSENIDSLYKHYILEDDIAVELYTEEYEKWFNFLESHVTYIDNVRNPTGIYFYMREKARQNGRFYWKGKEVNIPEGATWSDKTYQYDQYIPNNPDKFIICIVDHVGLLAPENDKKDLESLIDFFSNTYAIKLRDSFKQSIVTIQQQNLESENSIYVQGKPVIAKIKPKHSSLGDSRKPGRDADMILSIFSPYRFGLETYPDKNGYDITQLKDRYREMAILLNRRGISNVEIDLFFHGAVNHFEELPDPSEFKKNPKLYDKYLK